MGHYCGPMFQRVSRELSKVSQMRHYKRNKTITYLRTQTSPLGRCSCWGLQAEWLLCLDLYHKSHGSHLEPWWPGPWRSAGCPGSRWRSLCRAALGLQWRWAKKFVVDRLWWFYYKGNDAYTTLLGIKYHVFYEWLFIDSCRGIMLWFLVFSYWAELKFIQLTLLLIWYA